MKKKTFSPSYEKPTREEYFQQVNRCRLLPPASPRYKALGCKREKHLMIEGGRDELRYPGKYRREEERRELIDAGEGWAERETELAERLDEFPDWIKEHPRAARQLAWEWRTQWPDPTYRENRSNSAQRPKPSLQDQIDAALKRYMKKRGQRTGLLVPDTPYGLIEEGMPHKAAWILVKRAGRKFYPHSTEGISGALPKLDLLDKVERKAGAAIQFGGAEGAQIVLVQKGKETGILTKIVFTPAPAGRGTALSFKTGARLFAHKTLSPSFWEDQKNKNVQRIRREEGRSYRAKEDDPALLRRIFSYLSAAAKKGKGASRTISFYFSSMKAPVVTDVSDREHSKFSGDTAPEKKKGYKTLNVSLRQLPARLASLTRRKKHEGRRLPARTNPVNDDALTQLVQDHQKAAISAAAAGRSGREVVSHLISVPGQSNRVYWWSGTKKQLTQTTPERAKSWIGIAVAGKDTSSFSREIVDSTDRRMGLDSHSLSKENPMSQYYKGPYGGRRAIPTSRRNSNPLASRAMELHHQDGYDLKQAWKIAKGEARENGWKKASSNPRRKKAKKSYFKSEASKQAADRFLWAEDNPGHSQAATAMGLFHSGEADSLKEAWSMVKSGARNNPWYFGRGAGGGPRGSNLYLPDTTVVPGAFVPAEHPWDDETEVFSALVPGPYTRKNPRRKKKGKKGYFKSRASKSAADRFLWEERALQNPEVLWAKNDRPYIITDEGARFISDREAEAMENPHGASYWKPYQPNYSEVKGQFSTGLHRTSGTQPYARRNATAREEEWLFASGLGEELEQKPRQPLSRAVPLRRRRPTDKKRRNKKQRKSRISRKYR